MGLAHHDEPAARLRVLGRPAAQLDEPQPEAIRVVLARIAEQRREQGILEHAGVEGPREAMEGVGAAGEVAERRHLAGQGTPTPSCGGSAAQPALPVER